jgi:hypothetical protein
MHPWIILWEMNFTETNSFPIIPLGTYRHYKGQLYEVIGVARHSETEEAVVMYRTLYNHSGWWVRPYAMFTEQLVFEGVMQPRFLHLGAL